MRVEVFKTNVHQDYQAKRLVDLLQQYFPGSKINFDLDDCDKVLRVEGDNFLPGKIMTLVNENGFSCVELE